MIGSVNHSATQLSTHQIGQPDAAPAEPGGPNASARRASSQPAGRFEPACDATGLSAGAADSPARTSLGRTFDSLTQCQRSAQDQLAASADARRTDLQRQRDACTDPRQRELVQNRIEEWDAMSGLLGLQRQMSELSLSMELAAKAIETGNAGIKQISQTQT